MPILQDKLKCPTWGQAIIEALNRNSRLNWKIWRERFNHQDIWSQLRKYSNHAKSVKHLTIGPSRPSFVIRKMITLKTKQNAVKLGSGLWVFFYPALVIVSVNVGPEETASERACRLHPAPNLAGTLGNVYLQLKYSHPEITLLHAGHGKGGRMCVPGVTLHDSLFQYLRLIAVVKYIKFIDIFLVTYAASQRGHAQYKQDDICNVRCAKIWTKSVFFRN